MLVDIGWTKNIGVNGVEKCVPCKQTTWADNDANQLKAFVTLGGGIKP